MKDIKTLIYKLFSAFAICFSVVTLGGLIIYGNVANFFFPVKQPGSSDANAPAVLYYGITFLIIILFIFLRERLSARWRYAELMIDALISLWFAFSLRVMITVVHRPVYLYLIPILLFVAMMWLVMKYIFLNIRVRGSRLLLFTLLSSAAFTISFYVQYLLLGLPISQGFVSARFLSGVMLFVFLGLGLSISEYVMLRLEGYGNRKLTLHNQDDDDDDDIS